MIDNISIPLNENTNEYNTNIGVIIKKIRDIDKQNDGLRNIKKNLLEKFFQ